MSDCIRFRLDKGLCLLVFSSKLPGHRVEVVIGEHNHFTRRIAFNVLVEPCHEGSGKEASAHLDLGKCEFREIGSQRIAVYELQDLVNRVDLRASISSRLEYTSA